MKTFLLVVGLLILFAAEMLRVYFIMPFPGSQHSETISLAYWLANNISWIRLLAILLVFIPAINVFRGRSRWKKAFLSVVLGLYAVIFFLFNYRFEADKMFYQPKQKSFVSAASDTSSRGDLVIGVSINGEAKAYPIEVIGYHHQVADTVGGEPVMVTYCTVCRTGRVFRPFVNGKHETFRLVGMDHFNAMFEDATTKSWWRQATGEAIAGPLKGRRLTDLPSQQMTLGEWVREHPLATVLQPDSSFAKRYKDLAGYNRGTIEGSLERRDSASWKPKSWVVGVVYQSAAKAYDWNDLVRLRLINDSIAGLPLLVRLDADTASFHVFDRRVEGATLNFHQGSDDHFVAQDGSVWDASGRCVDGVLKGRMLMPVQSYQEFWHSWSTFHPRTERFLGGAR